MPFDEQIKLVRDYLVAQGYRPGEVMRIFVRGNNSETLVVHFAQGDPELLGDGYNHYVDTPGIIVGMLDRETGKISIPELL